MKKLFKFILNTIPRPLLIRMSIVVRPVLAFLLKGDRFTDPIDGKSFRMFLPYGYGTQRNNVLSPSTLSLERHRLLWLYLQNETDFFTAPASTRFHGSYEGGLLEHSMKVYEILNYKLKNIERTDQNANKKYFGKNSSSHKPVCFMQQCICSSNQ